MLPALAAAAHPGERAGAGGCALVALKSLEPWGVRPVLCSILQRDEHAAAAPVSGDWTLLRGAMSGTGLDSWDKLLRSLLNLRSITVTWHSSL